MARLGSGRLEGGVKESGDRRLKAGVVAAVGAVVEPTVDELALSPGEALLSFCQKDDLLFGFQCELYCITELWASRL